MVACCTAAATSPPPPSTSSARIADPLPNQLSSPPVHAPRTPPIATHHITGETTYVALDGHPFFCPISCDSCTRPGFRYIVDENCPCARCTTFATAPVATPTDIIAQRRRRLGPTDNLSYNDLQHLSEGDLFERLYPIHHASQENLPELAALARVNYEDALPTDPNNAASWLTNNVPPPGGDMDTSIIAPPSWRDIKTDIENALSVHAEGATPNIVALTAAAAAYMIKEYHPWSEDIPEDAISSIMEIFHFAIPRSRILDELIDDPDFMSLLAARAPQLLPAPNAPPRPRSRAGQAGPPPLPPRPVQWRPGMAKPAITYALASAAAVSKPQPPPKKVSPLITRKTNRNRSNPDEATFKPLDRVPLRQQGATVVERHNTICQASGHEARIVAVTWSRAGILILSPAAGISLETLRTESLNALRTGEVFGAVVRDVTLCYGTQGDQYTVEELIAQIVDEPLNGVDPTTLADNHRLMQSAEKLAHNPDQIVVPLLVNFVTRETRDRLLLGINNSHKIQMRGLRYTTSAFKPPSTHVVQCIKCWQLGHWISTCPAVGKICGICASTQHSKEEHYCEVCHKYGAPCQHKARLCINCKGDHPAYTMKCTKRYVNADVAQRLGAARPQ
ncbi:hypothetical protein BOTBODRAFT_177698 [Botryobasidium botryosum FD-172 SS1]|uniref:CCHC-type domain-containing protein n=1 Tax=Botryobasidium botryosum (strain FD-172 SS1) TaxID=930990 RepID=A0A067MHG4_BOTB1|nr:hypothetical protein BOTBODRAFT_177698 [Botryobasidium botryosum FD-172 SS1]